MKKKKSILKKCRKRILCFLLSATMILGCGSPVSAALPGQPQYRGVITNIVMKNVKGIALEYLERAILTGLGKAADATDGTLSDILSLTKRLLGSAQGVANSKIINMCSQMMQQLNDIENDLNETRAELNAAIGKVSQQISKNSVNSDLEKIDAFKATYQEVLNRFEDLTAALQNYAEKSEAGTLQQTDIDKLSDAYAKVDEFYKASGDTENTNMTFNFYDDLMEYLQVISPYTPTQRLADDLTDESQWGNKSDRDTYMDHLHELSSNGQAFEHQIYEMMQTGINDAVGPLTTYLTAYRIYVEYMVQGLNADASLSETERNDQIRRAWDAYYTAQNRITRAIQQMTSLYDDELGRYMRPYDVSQSLRMDYHSSGRHRAYINFVGQAQDMTLYAHSTSSDMPFYVVKPLVSGSNRTYAINQWTGSGVQYSRNITFDSGQVVWTDTCYAFSQDYYNLQKTANEDAGYTTIRSGNDLNTLTETKAFQLSGYYFQDYLKNQGGLENVPSIVNKNYDKDGNAKKKGSFALLSGRESWGGASADITLLNISMRMQPGELSNPEVEISTGDMNQNKLTNYGNDPMYVIMKADSNNRTISSSISGGSMTLYSVSADGSRQEISWGSGVASGTRLEVRITPDSGKILDTAALLNFEGQELYSFASDYEAASMLQEEDGSYVLTLPMPYQNVTISANCTNRPASVQTATLSTSGEGDLQFEGRNGISTIEYAAGDSVTVYARPYRGKMVDSVKVTMADGTEVSCSQTEEIPNTPNEQGYIFTMPDQDVTVTADYRDAYTVTFEESSNGYAMVEGDCINEEWLRYPVTFDSGDEVWIKSVSDDDDRYFCSNILVRGTKSGSVIPAKLTDNGIHFTMPDENVIVTTTFESLGTGNRVTLENNTEDQHILEFESKKPGETIQSNIYHYNVGATVKIRVIAEGRVDADSIRVVTYNGRELKYKYDENEKRISFTMPNENVSVYPPRVLAGSGTIADPYKIWSYDTLATADALMEADTSMCEKYYELTADIDGSGAFFDGFPEFNGQFDGNGYTISNLNLTSKDQHTGLFTRIGSDGKVSNLNLTNIQATGKDGYTGILTAENNGTVTNCHISEGALSGNGMMGGIVGKNVGYIHLCGVESLKINGSKATVGGIAGAMPASGYSSANLTDCYVRDMHGTGTCKSIGGLVGNMSGDTPVIKNCYVTANLSQGGILVGDHTAVNIQVENCYYLDTIAVKQICGSGDSDGWAATAKNAEAFASGEVTYRLNSSVSDGSQYWYQTLEGAAPDAVPRHDGMPVYDNKEEGYGNHHYINGICEGCGIYQVPAIAASDGVYEIRNAGEMFWFANQVNTVKSGQFARIMCDIDLENRAWTPIGRNEDGWRFNGVLDGQGYAIKNLKVDSSDDYQGFFGCVTGNTLIKDIGIESGSVKGNSYVGGLVGAVVKNTGSVSIERCYNNAAITALDRNAGGILGCNMDAILINIEDCYNTGTITGHRESAGISGWLGGNGSIKDCYNTGYVSGYEPNRVVFRYNGNLKISNVYYLDPSSTGQTNGNSKTASHFASGEVTWLLNGSTSEGALTWYQTIGEDQLPVLNKNHGVVVRDSSNNGYKNYHDHNYTNGICEKCGLYQPAVRNGEGIYEISNGGQMFWYAALVNGDYTHAEFGRTDIQAKAVLLDDIDLEDREWIPIGTYNLSYRESFDGQKHTITGLSITKSNDDIGFFGCCHGATIKDFTIRGNIRLSESAAGIGGVAGNVDKGSISGVDSYVNISNTAGRLSRVGGIVGELAADRHTTTIEKCMYYGDLAVSHSTYCIGGIVGFSNLGGTIQDCGNVGSVSSMDNTEAPLIGGILGQAYSDGIYVRNCYNYGKVSADYPDDCGAVVGLIRDIGLYENCYYLEGSSVKGTGSGVDGTVAKDEKAFAGGEVAYLLNTEGDTSENRNVWAQGSGYPVIAPSDAQALHQVVFQYNDANQKLVRHSVHYVNGGMRAILPENPVVDQQRFVGWFMDNGTAVKESFIVQKDMVLTGKFQPDDTAGSNVPTDKPQPDKTQPDKTQSDKPQSDKTQQNKPQPDKTQQNKPQSNESQQKSSKNAVGTGDDTNMIWLYLFIASGAVIVAAIFGKRRKEPEN